MVNIEWCYFPKNTCTLLILLMFFISQFGLGLVCSIIWKNFYNYLPTNEKIYIYNRGDFVEPTTFSLVGSTIRNSQNLPPAEYVPVDHTRVQGTMKLTTIVNRVYKNSWQWKLFWWTVLNKGSKKFDNFENVKNKTNQKKLNY